MQQARICGRLAAVVMLLAIGTTAPTAGQGANSLKVDNTGKVGIGTSTPQQKLHVADTTEPIVRLEQTAGSLRTWEIGASNSSFVIRDVTNSSAVPFAIAAGSPTNTLAVCAGGRVGIGTTTPDRELEIVQAVDAPERGIITSIFTGEGAGLTNAALIAFKKARGTRTAPAPVVAGDNIGFFRPFGYDGSQFLTTAFCGFKADTTVSPGSMPVAFVIGTGSSQFGAERLRVTSGGNVGIGTSTPTSKLHVEGGDVRVTGGSFIDDGVPINAPDYVFSPEYQLMPLRELASYVAEERHLPNVPSADDIRRSGLNLSQFQMQLLEKVEELTLHLIAQQREIDRLGALVADPRARSGSGGAKPEAEP